MKRILVSIILVLCVCVNVCYAADETKTISTALSVDDRVDEIVTNVLEDYESTNDELINYIEAAICINQVAGLSDNAVDHPLYPSANYEDITRWSSKDVYRRYFIGDYLTTMGYATVFPPIEDKEINEEDPEKLFYEEWYCDMIDKCTVRNALELAVNCLVQEYDDYIAIAKEKGLCGDISDYDKLISISELKELMRRMYQLKGELYYSSDLDNGIFSSAVRSSEEMSYHERYRKRLTFNKGAIEMNNRRVTVMRNDFGASLVGFRDMCNAYGIPIEWNDGEIRISFNGQTHDLRLDNFPDKITMLVEKSLYAWHPVAMNEMFVDIDKSFTCFGQYEMIHDSVYLYPKTFENFINYIGIETDIGYANLIKDTSDSVTVIEKDLERKSDRERIGVAAGEHWVEFYRPSGSPVYINIEDT